MKQDTLEPAPLEGVLQFGSPAGNTASERLGLGCCQVNGKCLEPLGSKGSAYTQVCNKPQCMRQYLPQDHWGMVGHMLHLCKNSNSVKKAKLRGKKRRMSRRAEKIPNTENFGKKLVTKEKMKYL